jgi:RNA polymerase sigma-B factor
VAAWVRHQPRSSAAAGDHPGLLGLADRLAGRYRHSRGSTPEDLVQTARAGLIAAIDRYDPDYGMPFVAYAVACVVGELKRYLRDTSWRVHVPRPLKERALRLCGAAEELYQRLGRSPTTTELAEHLQVDEEEVLKGLAAMSSRREVSLDQPIGVGEDAGACLGDLVAVPGAREEPEDLLALGGMLAALPELEREVIVLRFFSGPGPVRDRGPGRLLPDAHLPAPAPRLGPHACPTGGTLTWRRRRGDADHVDGAGHPGAGVLRGLRAGAGVACCRPDQASVIPPA